MKKILLAMLVMTLVFNAQAQIPNNSFESWSTTLSTYEDPTYWPTSNDFYWGLDSISFGFIKTPTSVFKTSPGNTGTYAIKLTNVVDSVYNGSTYDAGDTLPSFAITAFAYSQRPTTMTGFYKFHQGAIFPNIDSASIYVIFTKWNGSSTDTIGEGTIYIAVNASSYAGFTVPITYYSGVNPDSAGILITSSIDTDNPATYLIVDDLSFSSLTGLKSSSVFANSIALYPNPALDEINIKNIPAEASAIDIRDYTGKKVQSLKVSSDFMNFKTGGLSSGMYFYSIANSNGEVLYTDKFSVLK